MLFLESNLREVLIPTTDPSKLSPARLRDAFKKDISGAWEYFRRKHSNEQPYAVVLYGTEDSVLLYPQILTEESLKTVAQRYVREAYYETLDEARKALRYSVADSPLFAEFLPFSKHMEALVGCTTEELLDMGYAPFVKAACDVLKELDQQGVFGAGPARRKLLLVIITEDTEGDWADNSARRLNPPQVYQRFSNETKIEGVFKGCDALAISPDGRSIYMGGSRPVIKPKKQLKEDLYELVAFDVRGPRLSRRWTFDLNNPVSDVVCDPDGKSIVVARWVVPETILMRFASEHNRPLAEHKVNTKAQPNALAVSADGQLLALVMFGQRKIYFFDRNLRPLNELKLSVTPTGLRFLRNGDLLVASDHKLLRIRTKSGKEPLSLPLASFKLDGDRNESMLAVSRWFELQRRKNKAFGVQLLRLPSMKLAREIHLPDHQLVHATLSSDAGLLAVEAHHVVGYLQHIIVFDTASGLEIARRKSHFAKDIAFLPDSRTLAIGTSDFTTSEAVTLWNIAPR